MAIGKRLLLFSAKDPKAASLNASVIDWGCLVSTCESLDELRGRLEGADYDLVLLEPSSALKRLVAENSDEHVLQLQLAEVEKQHILRVLSSTGGNKTRAAKILGIDTKTLYNKLKSYKASDQVARKRATVNGTFTNSTV